MAKAVLLIPHLGPLPAWLDLFLLSCGRNPGYRFVIYSDQDPSRLRASANVEWRQTDGDRLRARVAAATGLSIPTFQSAYKLCDYRPAFGEIFADDIAGEAFWGHTDLDIVWGRLDPFLTARPFGNDLISGEAGRICGPFTLYRNAASVNSLYRRVPGYEEIFLDVARNHAFDELDFSDYAKSLAAAAAVRIASVEGGHGHSESRARYEYRGGRILREGGLKEGLRVAVRGALLPVAPPALRHLLPLSRERMFFHFRTWKSGMAFDFDPGAVQGWKFRPDRLIAIP